MEKLKELERLADLAFQRVFEDFMKNKDKKPVYQPTEDEIELAKKNSFGEDEESVYETFNQPFNTVWGVSEASLSYLKSKFFEKNSYEKKLFRKNFYINFKSASEQFFF